MVTVCVVPAAAAPARPSIRPETSVSPAPSPTIAAAPKISVSASKRASAVPRIAPPMAAAPWAFAAVTSAWAKRCASPIQANAPTSGVPLTPTAAPVRVVRVAFASPSPCLLIPSSVHRAPKTATVAEPTAALPSPMARAAAPSLAPSITSVPLATLASGPTAAAFASLKTSSVAAPATPTVAKMKFVKAAFVRRRLVSTAVAAATRSSVTHPTTVSKPRAVVFASSHAATQARRPSLLARQVALAITAPVSWGRNASTSKAAATSA